MSRISVAKRKSLPSNVWAVGRNSIAFALSFLVLATSTHGSQPSLLIPAGSYLATINIGNIYFKDGEMYFKNKDDQVASYENEQYPTPQSCWEAGYNLEQGDGKDLACDTGTRISSTWNITNAADFLNTLLVPYGNYIESCTGILRTTENGEDYLYASCPNRRQRKPAELEFPNRVKISDCLYELSNITITNNENIANEDGVLKCIKNSRVKPPKILWGSYLESSYCSLLDTNYDSDTGILTTHCGKCNEKLTYNATQCIGSGKDILVINNELKCKESSGDRVVLYTASLYLPAGNYVTSCRRMKFYPCLNRGRLVAECADLDGEFVKTQLDDGDGSEDSPECIKSYGYVSNDGGRLACDPSVDFNDASPTQRSMLSGGFHCPE